MKPKENTSERYFDTEILNRWAKIESELDNIQKEVEIQKKPSFKKRISELGGIIALVISILLGTFTVYEKTIKEPKKELQRELSQLNEIITQITELNIEALKLANDSKNNNSTIGTTSGVAQLNNAIKMPLLHLAIKIVDKNLEEINSISLLVIANELMVFEQEEKAFIYANEAMKKTDRPGMKAEAMRYMANSQMSTGNKHKINDAIKTYQNAINVAQNVTPIQRPWIISNIIRDWVIGLSVNGLCNEAKEVINKLDTYIGTSINPYVLETAKQQINFGVSSNSACVIRENILNEEKNMNNISIKIILVHTILFTSINTKAQDFPPGSFYIDGYPANCGNIWTTITPAINDIAKAIPGRILLHPTLASYPTGVKFFIYAHECAHHVVGLNEQAADTWAIQLGVQQGWINQIVIQQICQSVYFSPGDWTHAPGPIRCGQMYQAYQMAGGN